MNIRFCCASAAFALAVTLAMGPTRVAQAGASATPAAQETAALGAITVIDSRGQVVVTAAEIAQLPSIKVRVSFSTDHGPSGGNFEGPLLWLLLAHVGAVDPKKPREEVAEAVLVTGRDGYTAVLALGEIGPDFENKQVILATQADGKTLSPDHLHLAVPGDRRGGRNVRDVMRIEVTTVAPTK